MATLYHFEGNQYFVRLKMPNDEWLFILSPNMNTPAFYLDSFHLKSLKVVRLAAS